MNEHFPGSYDLAPDQDTLVAIVQAAGKVLKEKGVEGLENGRYQIDDSSAAANIFTYKLSPEIVHHIFFNSTRKHLRFFGRSCGGVRNNLFTRIYVGRW